MRKVFPILILILFSLMIISGCGQEDCSLKDSTYEKFTWDDDKGECISETIERDVCGNGVAEESENYCNCPKDVSREHPKYGCSGELGDYLEKSCNDEDECVLSQNEKVVEEVMAVEMKNSDIYLDALFTFNNPFILNSEDKNKLKAEITYLKEASSSKRVKNLMIKEMRFIANSKMIGSAIYNEELSSVGDRLSTKYIALSDTDDYETSITVKAEVMASYTVETLDSKGEVIKTEEKIETLVGSLGRMNFINPVFIE